MSVDEKMVAGNRQPVYSDFDDAAFEAFFKSHFAALCAYCQFRFGFETEAAKDVVHTAFLKLWETRETLSAELSLKAYLYKVAGNICLDILRHRKVRIKSEKLLTDQAGSATINNVTDHADLWQLSADVEKAVAEMPDQMRKVFELCRYEGLKYTEVASHLTISVKTVETQMSRALARLRQKLSGYLTILVAIAWFLAKQ